MKAKLSEWFGAHKIPVLIAAAALVVLAAVLAVLLTVTQKGGEETPSDILLPAAGQTQSVQSTTQPATTAPASITAAPQTTKVAQTTAAPKPSAPEEAMVWKDGDKTVYYPKSMTSSAQKYPVIVWANGTGCATATYSKLLTIFAEAGYIVVADNSTMTADGTEQRDSIDYILEQAGEKTSLFYQKVSTEKIGAAGHSQGGRSAVNAAQNDNRIQCVLSIAGASSEDEARGLSTPIFFMTGTTDMVVLSSMWVAPSYDAVTGRAVYASLKNGAHTTCMSSPEKISDYAVAWFDAYLKNDSAAKREFAADGALSKDSAWQDFACKN